MGNMTSEEWATKLIDAYSGQHHEDIRAFIEKEGLSDAEYVARAVGCYPYALDLSFRRKEELQAVNKELDAFREDKRGNPFTNGDDMTIEVKITDEFRRVLFEAKHLQRPEIE